MNKNVMLEAFERLELNENELIEVGGADCNPYKVTDEGLVGADCGVWRYDMNGLICEACGSVIHDDEDDVMYLTSGDLTLCDECYEKALLLGIF